MKDLISLILLADVINRRGISRKHIEIEGPMCRIEDPLIIPGPIEIDVALDPLLKFVGGSTISNWYVTDLPTFHYIIKFDVPSLTLNFEVTLDSANAIGIYSAEGYLDGFPFRHRTIPTGDLKGSGVCSLTINGAHVKGSTVLAVRHSDNMITMRRLKLDIVLFDSIELDLGQDFKIGDETIDWAVWSRNIKSNFDYEFAYYKKEISEKIRLAANNIIEGYTLDEFIDLIRGDRKC